MKRYAALTVLVGAIFATALQIVLIRHESRQLFVQSQKLQSQSVTLGREWGRLLLEQGSLVTHSRIERVASEQLDMTQPERKNVLVVGNR
ncbi:MAG: cell division protein FtsL [Gammaproteobacteria bacterium]